MENKTLAQIIQNNIRVKNLEGNRDIVIYDNASGANPVEDIALEIGATYEMFITSAFDIIGEQYGQQKLTLKLIPFEVTTNNYDIYMPVVYYDLDLSNIATTYIHIYKYNTELWSIFADNALIKIYKIVKKAV